MTKRIALLSLGLLALSACMPTAKDAMDPVVDTNDTMMDDNKKDMMMKDDDSDSMMDDDSKDAMMDDTKDAMMKKDEMMDEAKDDMMKKDEMMDTSKDAMMEKKEVPAEAMKKVVYTAYNSSVLANGETKVLFFHAAWCPTCRSADADLQAWFAANVATRNVYKVDYDTSAELKAKYGVTYQHTFVLVDGQGNALKTVQGPSDDVLKSMIGAQ